MFEPFINLDILIEDKFHFNYEDFKNLPENEKSQKIIIKETFENSIVYYSIFSEYLNKIIELKNFNNLKIFNTNFPQDIRSYVDANYNKSKKHYSIDHDMILFHDVNPVISMFFNSILHGAPTILLEIKITKYCIYLKNSIINYSENKIIENLKIRIYWDFHFVHWKYKQGYKFLEYNAENEMKIDINNIRI